MKGRPAVAWALVVLWLTSPELVSAMEFVSGADVLRGLPPVSVVVEDLHEDAESMGGLSASRLKTDVELRLRQAGVKVDDEALPYLYVNVLVMTRTTDEQGPIAWVYSVDLRLTEPVIVPSRDPDLEMAASTWEVPGVVGFVGAARDPARTVRDAVADSVDRFLNDYLAANPRTPPAGSR